MKVLLATDGLPAAEAAEQLLIRAARRDIDLRVATAAGKSGDAEEGTRLVAERAATRLEEAGFRPVVEVLEGDAGDALRAMAEKESIDLLVLGAGNKSWLGRILFGSLSTQVLHSDATVLVVNEAPATEPDPMRVLIALDGSSEGAFAADAARGLLDPQRCSIRLFSVVAVRVPAFAGGPVTGYASPGFDEQLEARLTGDRQRELEAMRATFSDGGFKVDARVTLGSPVKRILEEIRDTDASLVVLEARFRGALDRALVGSVSDQVARYAPASLIARPGAEAGA